MSNAVILYYIITTTTSREIVRQTTVNYSHTARAVYSIVLSKLRATAKHRN